MQNMSVWPIRIVLWTSDVEIDVNTVDFRRVSLSAWIKKVSCSNGQNEQNNERARVSLVSFVVFSCSNGCIERTTWPFTIETEESEFTTAE
jgi:hypothetical protein